MSTAEVVPTRMQVAYGVGSLFTSIFGTLPQVVLLYFMTSVLGIPPALAGAVVLTPKLVEVVFDPLLGMWSDRLHSRWGRRRPLMAAGTVLIAVTLPWLFNPHVYDNAAATALHVGVTFMLCTVGYSLFFVPYLSMPTEMTDDPQQRTRLMAWRIGFLSLGVLVAGAGAPWIVRWAGGGAAGHVVMGWVFTGVCVAAMTVAVVGTARARQTAADGSHVVVWQQLRLVASNRPFVMLAGAYGLQVCAQGAFAAALPYYIAHVLQRPQQTAGVLFLCVTGTALLALVPWVRLGRRLSKRQAYLAASALYALMSFSALLHDSVTPLGVLVAGFVLLGVGFGGMELFSHALLPDAAQQDRQVSGRNREALFSGVWIAVEKLGFAIGAAIVAGLLHLGGYAASTGGAAAVQPDAAVSAIRIAASVAPGLLFIASLVFIQRCRLPDDQPGARPAPKGGGETP